MSFKIGIIADSHGNATLIEAALEFLKLSGCSTVFHLGDICDSSHLAETADCIRLLQEHRVQAIKGNNDHVITRYHVSHENLNLTRAQMAYLNHLPLVRNYRDAIFAHSVPFDRELGLSCMVRPMDDYWINRFFKKYPDKVLFRGHNHDPEIVTPGLPEPEIRPLPLNQPIDLNQQSACIITCGAVIENLCVIWQPDSRKLESLSF